MDISSFTAQLSDYGSPPPPVRSLNNHKIALNKNNITLNNVAEGLSGLATITAAALDTLLLVLPTITVAASGTLLLVLPTITVAASGTQLLVVSGKYDVFSCHI